MSSSIGRLFNEFVCSALRDIRISQRLRVVDMVERTRIPLGSYSCLETARYRMSLENLLRIQIALGADIREIWPVTSPEGAIVTESLLEDLLQKARSRRPARITIEEILETVCSKEQISLNELIESRSRRAAQVRTLAAGLVREVPHLHLTDLARRLDRVASTLSHSLTRASKKRGSEFRDK